jgi:hypothetical protein
MRPIQVKQLDYDLTPTAGLALVGHFLKTLAPALADVDAALPVRTGVATSDIVRSYLGLLVQGKSDFDAIENLRGDKFFKQALGIGLLPSSPTLRQRMDAHALSLAAQVQPMIERLLTRHAPDYGVLPCGWLPLDIDTFAMVRREVAYVIVSPAHKVGDETGRSVGRSLPVHASSATMACEATGTTCRAFGPRRFPRGRGVTCQHQRGWGARLSGMVNTSELPQASLMWTSQRC